MRTIKTIASLKKLASRSGGVDCSILLNGNIASSKHIQFDDNNTFYVFNLIDDSEQYLNETELFTKSNVGEAIKKHALVIF